jgi:aspartate kinase
MKNKVKIFKFGGGVLINPDSFQKALDIIKEQKCGIVILSSIGKSTNALESIFLGFKTKNKELLEEQIQKYFSINSPFFEKGLDNQFLIMQHKQIKKLISEDFRFGDGLRKDSLLSLGEKASVFAFSNFLSKKEISNQIFDSLIKTDSFFGEAIPQKPIIIKNIIEKRSLLLNKKVLAIMPGFIGLDPNGMDTTLGRESSDYTAGLIANCLESSRVKVHSVTLWKNVPGLLKDKKDKNSLIAEISYRDLLRAVRPSGFAQGLVHYKTIPELEEFNIPLFIKNFDAPEENGTSIC